MTLGYSGAEVGRNLASGNLTGTVSGVVNSNQHTNRLNNTDEENIILLKEKIKNFFAK